VKRAALVRQFEALQALTSMAKNGYAHFGVSLLRPAFEELLWLEYLSANEDVAPKVAYLYSEKEVMDSLTAQNNFLGNNGMLNIGFTQKHFKRIRAEKRPKQSELKEIGRRLGWKGHALPSTEFVAKKVDRHREYQYLYQGTSRSVHFSPHELLRRVWGKHGQVSITSEHFKNYWADFALSWSARIFIQSVGPAIELMQFSTEQEKQNRSFLETIDNLRPIQIITASELESWR
jgi:hypothetical protein